MHMFPFNESTIRRTRPLIKVNIYCSFHWLPLLHSQFELIKGKYLQVFLYKISFNYCREIIYVLFGG